MRSALFKAGVILTFLVCSLKSQEQSKIENVLERFLLKGNPKVHEYRGTREMEAETEHFGLKARMKVETVLSESSDEGRVLTYRVISEEGSGSVRKRMKQLLDGERKAVKNGGFGFTAENYDFQILGPFAGETSKLSVRPKQKNELLIDGVILINQSGDLVRSEGRLIKSPSFWVSEVRIVMNYRQIGGVRMPINVEYKAKVKIIGETNIKMIYYYSSVNHVPVPGIQ